MKIFFNGNLESNNINNWFLFIKHKMSNVDMFKGAVYYFVSAFSTTTHLYSHGEMQLGAVVGRVLDWVVGSNPLG